MLLYSVSLMPCNFLQKHGDNAFPCFAISHYSEFESSKGKKLFDSHGFCFG